MPKHKWDRVVEPYVDYLNGLLNKTITDSRLVTLEGYQASSFLVTCFQGTFRPLVIGDGHYLYYRQEMLVVGDKLDIQEARYTYSRSDEINQEGQYVFRWEYFRVPPEPHIPHGHLHVYAPGVDKHIHFPTRRLSIEQVLWVLLEEYNVPAKTAKTEWYPLLQQGHAEFLKRTVVSEQELLPFP